MRTRADGYCKVGFPLSREYDMPRSMLEIARRRTTFLGARMFQMKFEDVLASAYMQGLHDAVQALTKGSSNEVGS